jgi:thiamine-phosphate pyrophosphorylase
MRVDFSLYLITDRHQTHSRDLSAVIEQALQGGVQAIQLREKDLPTDAFCQLAMELRQITERYGAKLLINGRADIARDVRADGLHLPEGADSIAAARHLIGPERLIGMSCHSLNAARAAEAAGADFITFGPVFSTPSKAVYGSPVGLQPLAEAAATLDIPVFALGGINRSNILQALETGARGAALISAILAADQPREAAADIVEILSNRRPF